jgi:hypothetical protein
LGARDSVLTGAAGEHYVLYKLHRLGLLAAQAPPNAYAADILVFSPSMSVGSMVQVKTRTTGRDRGWHMQEKHERLIHPRLFYALLDLEEETPVVYVLPSEVIANVVRTAHRTWLEKPGLRGQHNDTKLRMLLPAYSFPVPGLSPGWLDAYRERWDYLTTDEPAANGLAGPVTMSEARLQEDAYED